MNADALDIHRLQVKIDALVAERYRLAAEAKASRIALTRILTMTGALLEPQERIIRIAALARDAVAASSGGEA